jgi:hypothetical protein
MFLILTVIVAIHSLYSSIGEKEVAWPLRKVYRRCLLAFGRSWMFPITIYFFLIDIPATKKESSNRGIMICSWILGVLVLFRECFGIRSKWKTALRNLEEKLNQIGGDMNQLSEPESFAMNYFVFSKYSMPGGVYQTSFDQGKDIQNSQSDEMKYANQ